MSKTLEELKTTLTANAYADTVAGKLSRIEDAAELVGLKTNEFGITEGDPYLHEAALALADVEYKGEINVTLEGNTQAVNLTEGYYKGGTITVGDVSGNYTLSSPAAVTPTKAEQVITPNEGDYGIKQITVKAIPAKYQDVTPVTAGAADVLESKVIVDAAGNQITGSMANNGAITKTLDASSADGVYTNTEYSIAAGYHNGLGKISIVVEDKEVAPSESAQDIIPTAGKVLGKVTVKAIDKPTFLAAWTADATAVASDIFVGKKAYVNGLMVTGTLADKSDWDAQDHLITVSTTGETAINIPEGYHDGTGTVKVNAQDKTAAAIVPGGAAQTISADEGYILHSVTVPALDSKYQDVSGVTATAAQVLSGSKFVSSTGVLTTGTMASLGSVATTVDGLAMTSTGLVIKSVGNGYTTGGDIKLDSTIYDRLAAI